MAFSHGDFSSKDRSKDVFSVRFECKEYIKKFNFPISLFNRIPMWVFNTICAKDPYCADTNNYYTKLDDIAVFMLVNSLEVAMVGQFFELGMQNFNLNFVLIYMGFNS